MKHIRQGLVLAALQTKTLNKQERTLLTNIFNTVKLSIFYLAFFSCFLVACEEQKPPQSPLSEAELIPILKDICLAEAALQGLKENHKDSLSKLLYHKIYDLQNTQTTELHESIQLLLKEPEKAANLFKKVMEELSKEEVEHLKANKND